MNEIYSADKTELDGFTETDPNGITHHVVWELMEIAPDLEYDAWHCRTHDRLYFGGCNKVDKPYGR